MIIDGKVHNASTYGNHGCRCDVCRESHAALCARRTSERSVITARDGLPPYVDHGLSAYNNWGCRCAVCYSAKSAANRAGHLRRAAARTP